MSWRVFDEVAEGYDSWYRENWAAYESELKAIKALGVSGRGLEVGVGTAAFAAPLGVSVGVDPSLKMLNLAKQKGIEVVRAVGEALPFAHESFDYVLFVTALSFVEDVDASISEAHRVVRSGGCVVVCDVEKRSWLGREYAQKAAEGHPIYRFTNLLSLSDISEALERAGLRVCRAAGTLTKPWRETSSPEDPRDDLEECGFVCVKAVKAR